MYGYFQERIGIWEKAKEMLLVVLCLGVFIIVETILFSVDMVAIIIIAIIIMCLALLMELSRKNSEKAKYIETIQCVCKPTIKQLINIALCIMSPFYCCDYITDHHDVMLLGATGRGKTYLACAHGMVVVRKFFTVKYVCLLELLTELAIARSNCTYRKVIQQYKKRSC